MISDRLGAGGRHLKQGAAAQHDCCGFRLRGDGDRLHHGHGHPIALSQAGRVGDFNGVHPGIRAGDVRQGQAGIGLPVNQCAVPFPGVGHRLAAGGGHRQFHRFAGDDILILRQGGNHRRGLNGQGGHVTEHTPGRIGDNCLIFAGGILGEAGQGQGRIRAALDILPGVFPLVRDRIRAGDRDFENHTATHDAADTRRLRPDGDRLDHTHGNVITGHIAGKAAHLDGVVAGIGVLQICQTQCGSGGAVDQVAVPTPLVGQFCIGQGTARRNLQSHGAVQQTVRALGHRVDHRSLRQFMVQLHRAGLAPDAVHSNKIGGPFLNVEHDLAVLAIPAAVVIAGDLLERIPPAATTHLVNGQHRVEVTVFGGQLRGAFLRGGEGGPGRGATGVAGVVRLARILGRAGGGIDRRAAEREFARLLLDVPQLGDQAGQQIRPAENDFDFLPARVAAGRAGRQERAQVQLGVHFRVRGVLLELDQQLGALAHDTFRSGGDLHGVHPVVRHGHLVEHQALGRLASQQLIILVPDVFDVTGLDLQCDDKLRRQPHHAGRWLGLSRDHRQHGAGHLELPIQHHVPRRAVEAVHRHAVHLALNRVESHLAREIPA